MDKDVSIIVVGGLNTDIVALGVSKIIGPGEHTLAKKIRIGPGGKSRNIAQMIAALTDRGVAMVGKTIRDKYGFWKIPVDALRESAVNTDFVKILPENPAKFPAIALIPVDELGNNQIYVAPGITDEFDEADVDEAMPLFESAKNNSGILVLTLELPLKTAIYSVKKARGYGLKVLLDPGGIVEGVDYSELLTLPIFLIKPNQFEAKLLTGVTVKDFKSAKEAAAELLKMGIQNVLVTFGKEGGYLFNNKLAEHIPVPNAVLGKNRDETGCGDQTMAALAASLEHGNSVHDAAKIAVLAGTLQFSKEGIEPVTQEELDKYAK